MASERSERETVMCNSIEISLYLFIYMVRRTSVSARASNYVKWAELNAKKVASGNGH